RRSHAADQNAAFGEWAALLPRLEHPYLSATRARLPGHASCSHLRCACYAADGLDSSSNITHRIDIYDLEFSGYFSVWSCTDHLAPLLVEAGLFPATPSRVQAAFSFGVLNFFHSLQGTARLGAMNFVSALLAFHRGGTTVVESSASIPSQDVIRRQLRSASVWFAAVKARCSAQVPSAASLPKPVDTPVLGEDHLAASLRELAARCPACFGGLQRSNAVPATTTDAQVSPTSGPPQLIVCLDGNFQHKRRRKRDAVWRNPLPPDFFLSDQQVAHAREQFERNTVELGPDTGCGSHVKAAIDKMVKTTLGNFDIGGVIGMTCRHGSPLLFADVRDSGEAHYYAFALLQHLIAACGANLRSLGICYDIGCKLAVSPRMKLALQDSGLNITYAVSLFHVYGHDFDCQLKYSPRRLPGFGLTDGESLERLWSALTDMVSFTRSMTTVGRRQTLCARLQVLTERHQTNLALLLAKRAEKVKAALRSEVVGLRDLLSAIQEEQGRHNSHSSVGPVLSQSTSVVVSPSVLALLPAEVHGVAPYLASLSDQRRAAAFGRTAQSKRKSKRPKRVNLSVSSAAEKDMFNAEKLLSGKLLSAAQRLHVPLLQWHAVNDIVKRRDTMHSQRGTARLTTSMSGSAQKARARHKSFEEVLAAYNALLLAHNKVRLSQQRAAPAAASDSLTLPNNDAPSTSRLPQLSARKPLRGILLKSLFLRDTLPYLAALVQSPSLQIEPWICNPLLGEAVDRFEMVCRLAEEQCMLEQEMKNCNEWLKSSVSFLQLQLRVTEQHRSGNAIEQSTLATRHIHLQKAVRHLQTLHSYWDLHFDKLRASLGLVKSDDDPQEEIALMQDIIEASDSESDGFAVDMDRHSRTLGSRHLLRSLLGGSNARSSTMRRRERPLMNTHSSSTALGPPGIDGRPRSAFRASDSGPAPASSTATASASVSVHDPFYDEDADDEDEYFDSSSAEVDLFSSSGSSSTSGRDSSSDSDSAD
ncbi:hypothetical protein V8E36_004238, partial [Tilletia maclaganii]